ncbi:PREDICTED: uncharacterized protein LOC109470489 [Branchiostoma belcheri]|uniref:Uncharacterized protein LOC109470489 n=1 Tax=Branchiostoma belcheri TaxID=7741 RepID=A0A6P4YKQ4_BRABE|nr:PREDICTED: uncharacterized protein LOC109470489 [Branchiostoma belcheri]
MAASTRAFYNVEQLKHPHIREKFANSLDTKLYSHGPLSGSTTQQWDQLKKVVKETDKSTLGPKRRPHQDWVDDNDDAILQPLEEKRMAFSVWQNNMSSPTKRDRFKHLQRQTQAALRRMQDEIQHYCDTKNSNKFFGAIETVFGPPEPSNAQLKSANGNLLKEKKAINNRWREHFSDLLNRPSTVTSEVLDSIPQRSTINFLDRLPTLQELNVAIQQTSAGKAPGKDSIPADIFKAMGPIALDNFHTLLINIWEGGDMLQDGALK